MPRKTNSKEQINKAKFDEVCNELIQIRKDLSPKKCQSLNSYSAILIRYNLINTQSDEIKEYTTKHPSAKNKLRSLESKIAILMANHNLKYGIQPDYDFIEEKKEATPNKEEQEKEYKKQQFIKEKTLREKKLSEYTKLIKQLEAKRDEFHTRYPNDSCDDITNAYGASCQLVNILNGYAESYKNQDITLTQFKENSSRVIQNRRSGVLGEHRGVKELLINILLVIGTLGIGYAVAALFTQNLSPIKCNTDTVNLLTKTKEILDEVGEVNGVSI
ncbi:hypothetical protein [Legionella maioricensis]|uniref:Uncharacterized protein n=1 Tax=Legionella maioricensis TaxID=2896528 RepID=A0A9X2ICF8_9GAMM|nr:hypothetical protein [Legionella maioricensis]MCL9683723.1 hypothetical protein [Legionella maioricensis]MCL9687497.1 hypothetical protein [Legionella maioricensis]